MSMTTTATLLPHPNVATSRFDVERVRRDFPILHQRVHGKPLVYFDNAASTQKPAAVIEAIREYYEKDHANVHRAAHALSERATKAYEEARLKVMKFLHANCLREIVFTRGATEAANIVAQSYARPHLSAGDEIVVTTLEHHSNIVPWQMACLEKKAHLRVLPVADNGELKLSELDGLLSPKVKLLAIGHVSNALGTVNPIKDIIALAHRRNIPVFVDGAQAVSHLKVDVRDLDCDFYAFSGHKIYGPTGIGVLYGKALKLEMMPPYQFGGDMISYVSFARTTWNELPYKFEAGTPDIAGAVGLGAALDYVEAIGLERIAAHEQKLLQRATARLERIPGLRLIGTARDKVGVVSFIIDGVASLDVGSRLDLEGIAVRTGHHCCQPLMERFEIPGTVRASFALYNTLAEVDQFADALERIVAAARPIALAESDAYPGPKAGSPSEAADDLAEVFDSVDDWAEKYQYIIELGAKLPPMPDRLKTEANHIVGCQDPRVYIDLRESPTAPGTIEFLATADAQVVRGLAALLQTLFSGQRAQDVVRFDIDAFWKRVGLDNNLSTGRRTGLAAMAQRIRSFATKLIAKS